MPTLSATLLMAKMMLLASSGLSLLLSSMEGWFCAARHSQKSQALEGGKSVVWRWHFKVGRLAGQAVDVEELPVAEAIVWFGWSVCSCSASHGVRCGCGRARNGRCRGRRWVPMVVGCWGREGDV